MSDTSHCKPWSTVELDKLRELYPITPNAKLAENFPGRPFGGIAKQVRRLGLRKRPKGKAKQAPRPVLKPESFQIVKPYKESKHSLAAELRSLPFKHPLRVAYLEATGRGTKAGTAPRTMAELQQYAASHRAAA